MRKYTAEDFKNARFAEHPDGDFAARIYPDSPDPWFGTEECAYTDREMANTGWVPAPTKLGRTITRREFDELVSRNRFRDSHEFYEGVLRDLSITVVPDPEPTNAEKLADVYRSWYGGDEVPTSLIRFMDQAGVTAPEET